MDEFDQRDILQKHELRASFSGNLINGDVYQKLDISSRWHTHFTFRIRLDQEHVLVICSHARRNTPDIEYLHETTLILAASLYGNILTSAFRKELFWAALHAESSVGGVVERSPNSALRLVLMGHEERLASGIQMNPTSGGSSYHLELLSELQRL